MESGCDEEDGSSCHSSSVTLRAMIHNTDGTSDLEEGDTESNLKVGNKRGRDDSSPDDDIQNGEFITVGKRGKKAKVTTPRSGFSPGKSFVSDNPEYVEVSVISKEVLPKQITLAKLLSTEKIPEIMRIVYKSPYKILIRFKSNYAADKLLSSASIKQRGWVCKKTNEVNVSYGLIKEIDLDLDDNSIKDILECSEKFGCDYRYSSIAEGWFKYQEIPATWYDARLICSLEGAILASPSTPYKLAVMSKLIDDILDEADDLELEVFIGISATFAKGDFSSVDGIPLSEIAHRWKESEPDNKNNNEQCLTMNSDTLLSDVNCNKTLPYFCFKPQNLTGEIDDCGPKPEYNYDKRTKSCYKFHTEPRTFSHAYLACSAEGGYLTIINNDEEAQVIKELFSKYPATSMIGNFDKYVAFVGVNKWGDDGEWRTIHGETIEVAGYDKFSPSEPTNATTGEHCGAIYRSALLDDLWCYKPAPFICEKDPAYPPICQPMADEEIDINGSGKYQCMPNPRYSIVDLAHHFYIMTFILVDTSPSSDSTFPLNTQTHASLSGHSFLITQPTYMTPCILSWIHQRSSTYVGNIIPKANTSKISNITWTS
ncbi:uncharacterized protein LOC124641724 [Helicoverpa zea]|uniref:uncharacterized protein LOC124641724 n=1 Tax=Helicoverpa zea TaxID=7113 RepID=UPI001F57E888|nr:uncharacterized protein LOC124641724 [Helicoverpa zea]